MSEIAARAKRRKRRRATRATGLVIAAIGVAAFGVSSLPGTPGETVTVADGAPAAPLETPTDSIADRSSTPPTRAADASTVPSTELLAPPSTRGTTIEGLDEKTDPSSDTEATSSTDRSREGTRPTAPEPATTPGVRTSTTMTSNWEDGYCIQVEVINDNIDRLDWQVVLDLNGTIATLWNATVAEASGGIFVFSGQVGLNDGIEPGATTSFGTCIDTNAG